MQPPFQVGAAAAEKLVAGITPGGTMPAAGVIAPSDQGHLVGLWADPCTASRVDEPAVAVAEHAGFPTMLLDEQAVGLRAPLGVQIAGTVSARATAPQAGGALAGRAAHGQNRMTMGGEVRHGSFPRQSKSGARSGSDVDRGGQGRTASDPV